MKTFFNLVQEVLKPGLCSGCGGCVLFCSAAGYGALGIDKRGKPVYRDMEKCMECGLCHSICPETRELDKEIREKAGWNAPLGRVIETAVVKGTSGLESGPVWDVLGSLLTWLFDRKRIDGAVLAAGPCPSRACLALDREDVPAAVTLVRNMSAKQAEQAPLNLGFPGIQGPVKKRLKRLALVGPACQIRSLRKMQALNLVPADTVEYCFGFFCSGDQGEDGSDEDRRWDRSACRYCLDYSAELADISLGPHGQKGWACLISRSPRGQSVLTEGLAAGYIEPFNGQGDTPVATQALKDVKERSSAKKKRAGKARSALVIRPVSVKI